MLKRVKNYYSSNSFIFLIFDLCLLFYLISYFYFFKDSEFHNYSLLRNISTVSLVLSGLALFFHNNRLKHYSSIIWYFLFFSYCFLSILWAKSFEIAISPIVDMVRVLVVGIFLHVRLKSRHDIDIFLTIYCLASLFMVIGIFKQTIDFYSFSELLTRRFGDNFGFNSNVTAIMSVFCILICIYRIIKKEKKVFYIFLTAVFFVVLLLTASKKGIIGLIIGLTFFFIYRNKHSKKIYGTIASTLLIATFFIILVKNNDYLYSTIGYRFEKMFDTILTKGELGDSGDVNRLNLILQGFDIWGEHPLFGVGINSFGIYQTVHTEYYYAHSNYVEILADLGIIGFLLYYLYLFKIMFSKGNRKDSTFSFLKTIIVLILFFDLTQITYLNIRIVIFVWVFNSYLSIHRQGEQKSICSTFLIRGFTYDKKSYSNY